jgi:protein O-GlcNAc transferase
MNQPKELQSKDVVQLYNHAAESLRSGRVVEGFGSAQRCVQMAPGASAAWYIYGCALRMVGRGLEALKSQHRALVLEPGYAAAALERGTVYAGLGNGLQALREFERALVLDPGNGVALSNVEALRGQLGGALLSLERTMLGAMELQQAGKLEDARCEYLRILEVNPAHFVSLYSLAAMSLNHGKAEEGMQYAERCFDSEPNSALGWFILGVGMKAMRRFPEALESLGKAIELNADYKEAFVERGLVYGELKQYGEAIAEFNRVLAVDPNHELGLANLGTLLTIVNRNADAVRFFSRLVEVNPRYEYALGALTYARLHCCDWTDFEKNRERVTRAVRAREKGSRPLGFLAMSESPEEQRACAEVFMDATYPARTRVFWNGEPYRHRKMRVGYVSPDFREHPVGHLMAGVFESHNRDAMEVYAYSLGVNDASSLRGRFLSASDRFEDVRGRSSEEIARLIRSHEIDVLVDLAGPTMDAQPDIFAYRPAPAQVLYLGYPGTSGASYLDYVIADRTVIPEAHRRFYREEVKYLPRCYLPTDAKVAIADRTPSRAEAGLPDQGFVYCSFNHDYKINPRVFGVWMRILKRVEGSVLWLMKLNEAAEENLCKEARNHGVEPSRLVFASRVPSISDHLARYRLAGLFLDTNPYNAHTTSTDALRAGLPVLTVRGASFQGLVATSVVESLGLPWLSKGSLEEYEEFAVEVGSCAELAQRLKQEVADRLEGASLYDPQGMAADLEGIYRSVWRDGGLV